MVTLIQSSSLQKSESKFTAKKSYEITQGKHNDVMVAFLSDTNTVIFASTNDCKEPR